MVIGLCRVTLYLPLSTSLKKKRGILKGLLEKTRHRFNVSIAEIDLHDDWKRAEIGIVAISNERAYIHGLFQKIISHLERYNLVDLITYTTEDV